VTDWWEGEATAGELIARTRGMLGKSQYALARALQEVSGRGNGSPDRGMVYRWESGRRIPEPYWRAHLATVLHVPAEALDRACAVAKARRACHSRQGRGDDGHAGTLRPRGADQPEIDPGDSDVRRHEFLVLAGTAAAGSLAAPLVHGWPARRSARLPPPTDTGIAQLRAQTEGFRWLDRRHGAVKLLPATTGHAHALTRYWQLTAASHPLRGQLAEAAADACHLVAYQAYDQGQPAGAIEWYRCAAELAAQARARDLYVFAVCGVAYMHTTTGASELSLAVLRQLASLPLSAAARCYLSVYQAHGQAAAGRRAAALRALDQAQLHAGQSQHEAPSSWLGISDSSFVDRQRAMIAARFGLPDAPGMLAMLDRQTPAVFQRYRVTLLVSQATACARAGTPQPEQAAELLRAALDRNQSIGSAEKKRQILEARQSLEPYHDTAAVRDLDEAIAGRSGRSP
jgi:transcriptional regulator with XRE-family HTH domain